MGIHSLTKVCFVLAAVLVAVPDKASEVSFKGALVRDALHKTNNKEDSEKYHELHAWVRADGMQFVLLWHRLLIPDYTFTGTRKLG